MCLFLEIDIRASNKRNVENVQQAATLEKIEFTSLGRVFLREKPFPFLKVSTFHKKDR